MKKALLTILFCITIVTINLKGQTGGIWNYKYQIENTKMHTKSAVLIGTGAGGLIVGTGLMAYFIYGMDSNLGLGLAIADAGNMAVSLQMLITGGILRTVTNYNLNRYRKNTEKITYNIIYTPKVKGVGLTFRF